MFTIRLARFTTLFVFAIGCTGLDPGAFGVHGADPEEPESAGWSFDAGLGPDAGGRASSSGGRGTQGTARGGSNVPGDGGVEEPGGAGEGGEAGAAASGGFGGVATPGVGGAGRASMGGLGGARSGAGAGGRAAAGGGGRGGTGTGGRAGAGAGGAGRGGAGAGGASSGGAPVHALYFSEYVEGSSSYKALEIAARDASTLAGCRLVTYFNGSLTGSGIALDGVLARGAVTTLCSTALAALLGAPCARATNLTFNGDDAVALECDGVTLDVIGQLGVDPGDAWGDATASTLNQTLRRRCASGADADGSDAFEPARDWLALPLDTFEGVGVAECLD